MPLAGIHIIDEKGQILIFRYFRDIASPSVIHKFYSKLVEEEETSPIISFKEYSFLYIKHDNIYIVATCTGNSNVALVFAFLYKAKAVLIEYFNDLEEESVKDNFVVIYELLDEIIDFGFPQITESKILQQYITQESYKLEVIKPPPAVTNAVSWRGEGIKYRKNQVFIDVMENFNCLMSKDCTVLSCDINGVLKVDSQLSGMPELRMGFNDLLAVNTVNNRRRAGILDAKVELEDIKFHQCVRLATFSTNRTISFIPPDGIFELMSYRVPYNGNPLFLVKHFYEIFSSSRIKYRITVTSTYKAEIVAKYVKLRIPVPPDVDSPIFKKRLGVCTYDPVNNYIVWVLQHFQGVREATMEAELHIPTINQGIETKKPILVDFEVEYYAASRIQIKYLKVAEKSGYESFPWVKYTTISGNYQVRIHS